MRVVAVTNQFPLPLDAGGPLRFHGLARALARSHDVRLLALARANTTDELVAELSATIDGPVEVFEPSPQPGFAGRWLRALAMGVPTYVRAQWSDALASRLGAVAGKADAVVFLDDYAAGYAGVVDGTAPVLIDKSNVFGWSITEEPPPAGVRRRLLREVSKSLVRRFERDCLRHATAVVLTSSEESDRLERLYGRKADAVVPSGVDVPPARPALNRDRAIGWLGAHAYAPNTDGLVRFVEEAWEPLGREGCRLLVPGRNPPPEVRALERHPGVELVGFVEELDDWLAGLTAAVVPLWRGAGVKLKTLTFMAAGIPMAGTPVALEGVAAEDGRDCLVGDDPYQLAGALRQLVEDPEHAEAMGRRARELVERSYTWDALGPLFVEAVERAASARS